MGIQGLANNQVLVLNPKIDASEKQVLILNNFKTEQSRLKESMHRGNQEFEYFKPSKPGTLDIGQAYALRRMMNRR